MAEQGCAQVAVVGKEGADSHISSYSSITLLPPQLIYIKVKVMAVTLK